MVRGQFSIHQGASDGLNELPPRIGHTILQLAELWKIICNHQHGFTDNLGNAQEKTKKSWVLLTDDELMAMLVGYVYNRSGGGQAIFATPGLPQWHRCAQTVQFFTNMCHYVFHNCHNEKPGFFMIIINNNFSTFACFRF